MSNPKVEWIGDVPNIWWIQTKDQKPTRKDADQDGCVIAAFRFSERDKIWRVRFVGTMNVRDDPWAYPLWIPTMKHPATIKGLG